jgi:hypothetical protein
MIFRYHLSFNLLINTAVVILFVKSGTGSYKLKHCFVNFIFYVTISTFFIMITRNLQKGGVSANFKPYMNYWSRDSLLIYFWKWVSRWHINQHGVRFSRNHFGHSVVVPNHIFIAFNNLKHEWDKENLQIGFILLYYNQHEKGMTLQWY